MVTVSPNFNNVFFITLNLPYIVRLTSPTVALNFWSIYISLTFTKLLGELNLSRSSPSLSAYYFPFSFLQNWVSRSVEQRCLHCAAEGGSRSLQPKPEQEALQ